MLKKYIPALFPILLIAAELPPSPPAEPPVAKEQPKQESTQTPPAAKSETPAKKKMEECDSIPPMLLFLPPMLEDDLKKCKNKMGLPVDKEMIAKNIAKMTAKTPTSIDGVSIVEGFKEVYKIDYSVKSKKSSLICNSAVTTCFEGTKILELKSEKKASK